MKQSNKAKPDLSGWGIAAFEKITGVMEEVVREATEEAIGYALADDSTHLGFPAIWDRKGQKKSDPLTVRLYVGVAPDGGELTYDMSLRDYFSSDMDDCREDGSFAGGLARVAKALRSLADDMDSASKAGKILGR